MRMRITLTAAVAVVAALSLVSTSAAGGTGYSREGVACVKAGVSFLASNGLLVKAALQRVDYEPLDSDADGAGLINTDLPAPSYLPLLDVIKLHYTNPELFDWCSA